MCGNGQRLARLLSAHTALFTISCGSRCKAFSITPYDMGMLLLHFVAFLVTAHDLWYRAPSEFWTGRIWCEWVGTFFLLFPEGLDEEKPIQTRNI